MMVKVSEQETCSSGWQGAGLPAAETGVLAHLCSSSRAHHQSSALSDDLPSFPPSLTRSFSAFLVPSSAQIFLFKLPIATAHPSLPQLGCVGQGGHAGFCVGDILTVSAISQN